MGFQDWPLMIFSLLAQLATGSFVVLGIVRFSTNQKERETDYYRLLDRGWIGSFVIMVIALIVSLIHLGSPLNAPLTILNIGSAWLSREILFGLLFAFFAGLFTLFQWQRIGSRKLRDTCFVLGGLAGIALVYSMSMIYRYVETQPSWNTPWTTVMFFLTAGLLGNLAVAAVVSTNFLSSGDKTKTQDPWYRKVLRGTSIAALVFIGLDVLVYLLYILGLFYGVPAAQETAKLILGSFGILFSLRILFVLVGSMLGGLFLIRLLGNQNQKNLLVSMAYSAFAFVLAAEGISRFLFYSVKVRIGI